MEREEEISHARQRIAVLSNEKDILKKLSEENYLSLQDLKKQLSLSLRATDVREQEALYAI